MRRAAGRRRAAHPGRRRDPRRRLRRVPAGARATRRRFGQGAGRAGQAGPPRAHGAQLRRPDRHRRRYHGRPARRAGHTCLHAAVRTGTRLSAGRHRPGRPRPLAAARDEGGRLRRPRHCAPPPGACSVNNRPFSPGALNVRFRTAHGRDHGRPFRHWPGDRRQDPVAARLRAALRGGGRCRRDGARARFAGRRRSPARGAGRGRGRVRRGLRAGRHPPAAVVRDGGAAAAGAGRSGQRQGRLSGHLPRHRPGPRRARGRHGDRAHPQGGAVRRRRALSRTPRSWPTAAAPGAWP